MVPVLLIAGNKLFGLSTNFRHLCAMTLPSRLEFFRYDWKRTGLWNLVFILGVMIGGWIASHLLANPAPIDLAESTRADLLALGITNFEGMAPQQVFQWSSLLTPAGLVMIVGGGFLVGFGARWAGGCTSGHGISGLAAMQVPSLAAVIGFFAGGIAVTHLVLPLLLRASP
jgi:uncharacterized membrane protein YedE/YeeE